MDQQPPNWQQEPPQLPFPPNNNPWQQQPNTSYPPQQPFPPPQFNQHQYSPQYQQQPPMPPPGPPKKKRGPLFWVLLVIGALLVCGACSGIGSAISRSSTTATTSSTFATQATDTSVPTDTPIPTDTPTPSALTDKGAIKTQLQSDISNLALVGDIINADYADHAIVLVGLKQQPDHGYLVAMVQSECYSVQKTVWQDPLLQNVNWLDYSVFTQDSQGLPVVLGECILHAQKAASINWDNYDATSAWDQKIYENMLLGSP
jgi:hypothetical protein